MRIVHYSRPLRASAGVTFNLRDNFYQKFNTFNIKPTPLNASNIITFNMCAITI